MIDFEAIAERPLCVALDSPDADRCIGTARAVAPSCSMLKLGLTAFIGAGAAIVEELASLRPVFVDLNLHDIPAQVEGAARAAAERGATLTTVHAAGGEEMVRAAVAGAGDECGVLAVTVLTSIDDEGLRATGIDRSPVDQVLLLADLALASGAAGLVCSPREVGAIRARFGARADGGPLLGVPGIRPRGSDDDDQRRTLTPADALAQGADLLVVGRPVTSSDDPAAAAAALLEDAQPTPAAT